MAANLTVTGKVGPASTVTALVLTGATSFSVNPDTGILSVYINGVYQDFDISAATTMTVTISGTTYTVVIS